MISINGKIGIVDLFVVDLDVVEINYMYVEVIIIESGFLVKEDKEKLDVM